jgi:hypothetical protein
VLRFAPPLRVQAALAGLTDRYTPPTHALPGNLRAGFEPEAPDAPVPPTADKRQKPHL